MNFSRKCVQVKITLLINESKFAIKNRKIFKATITHVKNTLRCKHTYLFVGNMFPNNWT